jgi:hypothetical protein
VAGPAHRFGDLLHGGALGPLGDTEGDSLTFSRQPLQITCARIALE